MRTQGTAASIRVREGSYSNCQGWAKWQRSIHYSTIGNIQHSIDLLTTIQDLFDVKLRTHDWQHLFVSYRLPALCLTNYDSIYDSIFAFWHPRNDVRTSRNHILWLQAYGSRKIWLDWHPFWFARTVENLHWHALFACVCYWRWIPHIISVAVLKSSH